ncbi:hypothetical protein EYF80_031096 [Liparis tanakae]|uniref:Uncharacterized protein n=1 Tax=Liparis tanakae TaxID=230148 RepID=A0A4Z2H1A5_9TELE|nr:hypothetical protein EYF80_031096 [Liparis tanakae]
MRRVFKEHQVSEDFHVSLNEMIRLFKAASLKFRCSRASLLRASRHLGGTSAHTRCCPPHVRAEDRRRTAGTGPRHRDGDEPSARDEVTRGQWGGREGTCT